MKCVNNILSINNLAVDDVLSVEPWAGNEGDEELRAICVFTGICHWEEVRFGMLDFEVFVFKLVSVDGLSSSAVMVGEVTSLGHEVVDDTMESWSLVSKSFLAGAESSEVGCSFGDDVIIEFEDNFSSRVSVDGDVEEHVWHI